jgi:hypothetical protein
MRAVSAWITRRTMRRRADRLTAGLAGVALATAGTVMLWEGARLARRRAARRPPPPTVLRGAEQRLETAGRATQDTVAVLVEGYEATSRHETVLFNLLSGFVLAFALVRLSTAGIRSGWWPAGNVRLGGRHIHHFVPGILLVLLSGGASIGLRHEQLDHWLALPFGAGAALIVDETALLIELNDVYWADEGVLSIDVGLGATSALACLALLVRIVLRGEAAVLPDGGEPPAHVA